MIKINRKVEYALMVLKHMKDKSVTELTTAREVCDKFSTPFDTTAKVMQLMCTARLLQSQKGVKGGYTLSMDLTQVSYLELAQLIEGKSFQMDCDNGPCGLIHKCNISGPVKRLNNYLISIFNTLSLSELLADDTLMISTHTPSEHKVMYEN